MIIGFLVVVDYGESWDEQLRYRYADRSMAAYFGDIKTYADEKGPFYVMLAKIGSEALLAIRTDWSPIEAWHFMHFLSFQMGIFFFYVIVERVTNKWAAFGTMVIFATQPLLWGHAFINPKDIPCMSFFLGSVALGLLMYDSLTDRDYNPANNLPEMGDKDNLLSFYVSADWVAQKKKTRIIALVAGGLVVVFLIGLILADNYNQALIANFIHEAYNADPTSRLGAIFANLAENKQDIPVANYVQKSLKIYQWVVQATVLATVMALLIIARALFPSSAKWIWRSQTKPFLYSALSKLRNKWVVAAGIMLGLTSSIRILGPAAGFLVGGYILLKGARRSTVAALAAYFFIACLVTYITWPALWSDPFQSYLGSIFTSSDFPWEGKVMFGGIDYSVDQLPRSYLPILMSVQFTEPALLLFLFGLAMALVKSFQKRLDRDLVAMLIAWLLLPLIVVVILQPTMYDNFRQFLFITPPILIFAGIGLQALFDKIKSAPVLAILLAVIILFNITWIVKLHPYQYIYYNSFVGGVGGAFREYEMDYWATSYREDTQYINEISPPNSEVIVWGPEHVVTNYAREDLRIEEFHKKDQDQPKPADYAIISTRHNKDLTLFPEAELIFGVGREGALFVVVKQFNAADPPNP